MNRNKELAYDDFINMLVNSWTYNRLTDDEKNRVRDSLRRACDRGAVIGNYKQRFEILHAVYFSFLLALEYVPIGWRE